MSDTQQNDFEKLSFIGQCVHIVDDWKDLLDRRGGTLPVYADHEFNSIVMAAAVGNHWLEQAAEKLEAAADIHRTLDEACKEVQRECCERLAQLYLSNLHAVSLTEVLWHANRIAKARGWNCYEGFPEGVLCNEIFNRFTPEGQTQ